MSGQPFKIIEKYYTRDSKKKFYTRFGIRKGKNILNLKKTKLETCVLCVSRHESIETYLSRTLFALRYTCLES